ncbi:FxsA family protein [Mycolicibacterium sp. Dal123E01]|uniref:FxsA family protein n=1 Tax=Mycolicibacterium sp. Dal123E01 TaxID=3457578 RepID=UPI00403E5E55
MRMFFLYALVELAVLAALTWSLGIGWTLLILLATSVLGVALAGSQIKRQILRLQQARTNPQGAVADGLLVALGTVLMFIPGLVSTAVGALMLLPPTRSVVRPLAGAVLTRGIARRVTIVNLTAPAPQGHGDYIDGEIVDEQVDGYVSGPVHDANIVRRY